MTTAKEFEFAHTLLSTMEKIRVSMLDIKFRKFEIQCATKQYQNANRTLRERHPTLFQNETYMFPPNNDLVMTLPFKYVNQLERGKLTPLEEKWLKKIKQTLRQAETSSIRSIQLVRCLGDINVDSVFWQSTPVENPLFSSQFVYQINMGKSMCYVSSSQINEIIGKELWVDGEWHSLSNLATGRLVTLSYGAKKKDKQDCKEIEEEKINFSVGELVVFMNHGDAWRSNKKSVEHAKLFSIQH
jgi:hypothetical protein